MFYPCFPHNDLELYLVILIEVELGTCVLQLPDEFVLKHTQPKLITGLFGFHGMDTHYLILSIVLLYLLLRVVLSFSYVNYVC
uniref:Uncharacterized protein n=1 Tax=Physcomitrium patens TaxID=3218 RepID=A0A2K1ISM4_PHYPA|nr:hypothetical protein PHYPA_026384 [Physcomitrium patens]